MKFFFRFLNYLIDIKYPVNNFRKIMWRLWRLFLSGFVLLTVWYILIHYTEHYSILYRVAKRANLAHFFLLFLSLSRSLLLLSRIYPILDEKNNAICEKDKQGETSIVLSSIDNALIDYHDIWLIIEDLNCS